MARPLPTVGSLWVAREFEGSGIRYLATLENTGIQNVRVLKPGSLIMITGFEQPDKRKFISFVGQEGTGWIHTAWWSDTDALDPV